MTVFPALVALLLASTSRSAQPPGPPPSPPPGQPLAPPVASLDGLPIGSIPQQQLPRQGCAAYLWTASGTRALIAMVTPGTGSEVALLRFSLGGKVTDLARSGQLGAANFGFPETTTYAGGGVTIKLTMRIETRASITGGAVVPDGLLELDRTGQDSVVIPVAGLVGCA